MSVMVHVGKNLAFGHCLTHRLCPKSVTGNAIDINLWKIPLFCDEVKKSSSHSYSTMPRMRNTNQPKIDINPIDCRLFMSLNYSWTKLSLLSTRQYSDSKSVLDEEKESTVQPQNMDTQEVQKDFKEEKLFNPEDYREAMFTAFYYLPQIRLIRFVCRIKLYQTMLMVFSTLPATAAWQVELLQLSELWQFYSIALFATAMLYGLTFYTRRLVGVLSLSEDMKIMKVSHLTFFGLRHDALLQVKDVVRLDDLRGGSQLLKLKTKDSAESYFFSLKFGQIRDRKMFDAVFNRKSDIREMI